MARADVKTRRWKRVEYERLIESGFFQPGDPIELVGGPDVAVVPGTFRDYVIGHPSQPVLVVEVSESSLALDREHKGSVYARARVADYWIVNLVDRVLEVYREPIGDQAAPFGWRISLDRSARAQRVRRPARRGGRSPPRRGPPALT